MIGWAVITCLVFSVIESQLILPYHLAHRRTEGYLFSETRFVKRWIRFQGYFCGSLESFANNRYKPFLIKTLEWHWVTWAVATGVLLMAIALISSGRVIFQFFPAVEGE